MNNNNQESKKELKCPKCKLFFPISGFSKNKSTKSGLSFYCKKCMIEIIKVHRKKTDYYRSEKYRNRLRKPPSNDYFKRNKEKLRAREEVKKAIKEGRLIRGICLRYGNECQGRIEAHHEDYSKPLDVIWLCIKHHHQQHYGK